MFLRSPCISSFHFSSLGYRYRYSRRSRRDTTIAFPLLYQWRWNTVRVAEAAVLTFHCRPGPSTCQGLWLMSLIFRTQSARVALMSRERVWCSRGLYAVSTPCGGHLGLPRDEGKRRGLARGSPGYELMRTAWITERVAIQTSLVVLDSRTAYKKKEANLVSRRKFTSLSAFKIKQDWYL